VRASVTIRDDLAILTATLLEMAHRSDVLICTGGLGPTPDDLTVDALAAAAKSPLEHDEDVWSDIVSRFGKRTPSQNNRRQARIPQGATALRSMVGTAPGIRLEIAGCTVFALPGVSREMKWHFDQSIAGFIKDILPKSVHARTLMFAGIGESSLAQRVQDIVLPKGVDVLYRTHLPENHIRLRADQPAALAEAAAAIIRLAPTAYLGDDAESLPEATIAACRRRGLTLGTAESCTGGLIGATITEVSGASDVYVGSVVSYSNDIKTQVLGVGTAVIHEHGAVSEETARAMASGAQSTLGCDIAVSITGIAGPNGGTADKPVGTVWFSWKGPGLDEARCKYFTGDRHRIRRIAMGYALDRIRRHDGQL
jgi:nicotinamide-nucleotide amidase